MYEYLICAPAGAFGNHVRWLMLLDDRFNLKIERKNYPVVFLNNVDDKVNFIKESVYTEYRTWNNWLEMEWIYREQIAPYITLTHQFSLVDNKKDNCLAVLVTATPEMAYKRYLKFNSNLNNLSPTSFKEFIAKFNSRIDMLKENKNTLVVDSDRLFYPSLDKDLYNSVVDFFQFKSYYSIANDIHNIWYNLHKKAEIELLRDMQAIYPTKE